MHALAQTSKATRQTRSTTSTSFFTPSLRQVQRACACSGPVARSGCTQCAAESARHGAGPERGESADAPPIVEQALQSPGQPLDTATRAFFETRFHVDFGHVRVHTDATAGESARSVDAKAYTVGPDVVFGAGQFAPGSAEGKSLLAHELTHVVQQGGGAPGLAGSGAHGVQRTPTFKDCKTKEKGKEDAKEKILAQAAKDAAPLVQGALDKLNGAGIVRADLEVGPAFQAHFGDPDDARVKAVVKVYEDIKKSLDAKDFVCLPKCPKDKKDPGKGDACARAAPGNLIQICPEFFRSPCADLGGGLIVLHESAHNAGAMGNQDFDPKGTPAKKRKYPPADGEKNAYSYQHFADDMQKGTFKPRSSGSVKEHQVEVKPTR